MTITTLQKYRAAARQIIPYTMLSVSDGNASPDVVWEMGLEFPNGGYAGPAIPNTGYGGLVSGGNTTGTVPNATTSGYPAINSFGTGNTGYIGSIEMNCCPKEDGTTSQAFRIMLFDVLFVAGYYSTATVTSTQTLSSQPSYSSRLPLYGGNPDYNGLQLWLTYSGDPGPSESCTATVTYTNQSGTPGQTSTLSFTSTSSNNYQSIQMPLAAGDTGIQTLDTVYLTTSAGTIEWSYFVLRPLWQGRAPYAGWSGMSTLMETGLVQVFDSQASAGASALTVMLSSDASFFGYDLWIEVVNG
jgi:hypothetical protein